MSTKLGISMHPDVYFITSSILSSSLIKVSYILSEKSVFCLFRPPLLHGNHYLGGKAAYAPSRFHYSRRLRKPCESWPILTTRCVPEGPRPMIKGNRSLTQLCAGLRTYRCGWGSRTGGWLVHSSQWSLRPAGNFAAIKVETRGHRSHYACMSETWHAQKTF